MECVLADQTEEKTTGEIDEQRAVGERAGHFDLDQSLEAVAGQRADSAEERNEEETQRFCDPAAAATKKLLEPRGSQEASAFSDERKRLKANSIAFGFVENSVAFESNQAQAHGLRCVLNVPASECGR